MTNLSGKRRQRGGRSETGEEKIRPSRKGREEGRQYKAVSRTQLSVYVCVYACMCMRARVCVSCVTHPTDWRMVWLLFMSTTHTVFLSISIHHRERERDSILQSIHPHYVRAAHTNIQQEPRHKLSSSEVEAHKMM